MICVVHTVMVGQKNKQTKNFTSTFSQPQEWQNIICPHDGKLRLICFWVVRREHKLGADSFLIALSRKMLWTPVV